ncbi:FlxA-like family protein [Paenibacillus thiaminolyticus]|uniref:FlxA-like family protein n=1 Tax=Paenibacillus thiaminolyticus TaxID=49283 RepID=A0AAP9DTW2_PANTH|nr:FlxA-like family protein [Paenibacillus thiaminolyticus]MCY9535635.1 FlxA-like family protein [Paenibacillus thiaminolyticus]MCY9600325.1 FlxA-like family protein [Paenibacillus thiaminolyticus]MCY9607345.1 FlxA-like family protein [Paenibacillus thiaminolyticus]MCY9613912.1 FlxA-like family protein [Paenibacillus thiaminolyticus]MCY9617917.1 FlxA-like family protein [Paenibacillus thiaminolyticus]
MNVSAVSAGGLASTGSGAASGIDRQIERLNKRKAVIAEKMLAVATGDDEQKVKDEKIKALKMEMQVIDMQIQQLLKKKMEMEKKKQDPTQADEGDIGPSISELIQPDNKPQGDSVFIDLKL